MTTLPQSARARKARNIRCASHRSVSDRLSIARPDCALNKSFRIGMSTDDQGKCVLELWNELSTIGL
jgi:hypothetical protein